MQPALMLAMTARLIALLIAVLALTGLIWQFQINGAKPGLSGVGIRLWLMSKFFTNFANLLVALVTIAFASRRAPDANVMVRATLSIVMVGIVYQGFLAGDAPLPVPHWYPDFLLHVAVPVLMPLWWLAFADKSVQLSAMPLWLSPPAAYSVYALIRGWITGVYPYFFFDIGRFGFGTVLLFCLGLVAVFAICGLVLWLIARLATRRSA